MVPHVLNICAGYTQGLAFTYLSVDYRVSGRITRGAINPSARTKVKRGTTTTSVILGRRRDIYHVLSALVVLLCLMDSGPQFGICTRCQLSDSQPLIHASLCMSPSIYSIPTTLYTSHMDQARGRESNGDITKCRVDYFPVNPSFFPFDMILKV